MRHFGFAFASSVNRHHSEGRPSAKVGGGDLGGEFWVRRSKSGTSQHRALRTD